MAKVSIDGKVAIGSMANIKMTKLMVLEFIAQYLATLMLANLPMVSFKAMVALALVLLGIERVIFMTDNFSKVNFTEMARIFMPTVTNLLDPIGLERKTDVEFCTQTMVRLFQGVGGMDN